MIILTFIAFLTSTVFGMEDPEIFYLINTNTRSHQFQKYIPTGEKYAHWTMFFNVSIYLIY